MTIPLRVLILETDHKGAESIAQRLRAAGLEPNWRRVDSEHEYLAALDPPPDLILADHTSPRFSAHHARKRLQERGLDVPFMALSGANGEKAAGTPSSNGHSATSPLPRAAQWRLGQAVSHALEQMLRSHQSQQAQHAGPRGADHFRALVEKLPDGVSLLDADGTIRYISPSAASMLGYSPEELVGTSALELLYPDELGRLSKRFLTLLRRPGCKTTSVHRALHKDGSWRWLESSGRNCLGEPPLSGIVHTFRDVTARVQSEQALRRAKDAAEAANRARAEFLSSMGHDLRTPLNAVIGFSGILLMNLSGPLTPKQTEQLQTIERSANALLAMIDDLMTWNKIESGMFTVGMGPVVFQEVIAEVVESLEPLAATRELRIKSAVPAEDIQIRTDRRVLADVVHGLLERAIKATNCGEVQLTLERQETAGAASVSFGITLRGPTLEADELAEIWGPLGHDDVVPKRNPSAGLWRNLYRKLARLLGGDLCLCMGLEEGTTLILTVPEHSNGNHSGGR